MNKKGIGLLLVLALVLSVGSFWYFNQSSQRKATRESKTSQEIPSDTAIFYTPSYSKRDTAKIRIPFSFKDKSERPLWLYLSMSEGDSNFGMLAYYPQIQKLNWNFLESGSVNLFQKNKIFESLEDFVANTPDPNLVVIDEIAAQDPRFQDTNFEILSDDTDFTNKNFIITTYKPVQESGGWLWQETTVDATKALINDSNQMVWTIQAPGTTPENPYYLGEINLVYE